MKELQDKVIVSLYLLSIIKDHAKSHNINLSEEFNYFYIQKYFNITSLKHRLIDNKKQSISMEEELFSKTNLINSLWSSFSDREKGFIAAVPDLLSTNKTLMGLYKKFIYDFGNKLLFIDFCAMIDLYENGSLQ